jgi:hypothetical protein
MIKNKYHQEINITRLEIIRIFIKKKMTQSLFFFLIRNIILLNCAFQKEKQIFLFKLIKRSFYENPYHCLFFGCFRRC